MHRDYPTFVKYIQAQDRKNPTWRSKHTLEALADFERSLNNIPEEEDRHVLDWMNIVFDQQWEMIESKGNVSLTFRSTSGTTLRIKYFGSMATRYQTEQGQVKDLHWYQVRIDDLVFNKVGFVTLDSKKAPDLLTAWKNGAFQRKNALTYNQVKSLLQKDNILSEFKSQKSYYKNDYGRTPFEHATINDVYLMAYALVSYMSGCPLSTDMSKWDIPKSVTRTTTIMEEYLASHWIHFLATSMSKAKNLQFLQRWMTKHSNMQAVIFDFLSTSLD